MLSFTFMPDKALRALNRRLLASQYLSRKATGPNAVVKVAEACCGINSQDYLESFSSFWARVDDFKGSDLTSELRPKGGLVRTWTVRHTVHTIPARDYYIHVFGGCARRWHQAYFDKVAKSRGIGDREFRVRSLYEPLLDHIKGRAATSKEVKEFIMERLAQHGLRARMKLLRGYSSQATMGPAWTGVAEMSNLGLLVSAGRKGSEGLWMRTADWLSTRQKPPSSEECMVELVRKYIEHYGPVTREDILYWSYLLRKDVDTALGALKKEVTRENYGSNQEYFSLKGPGESFEPPTTIILPEFDSLMMGYKDKSRFLSHQQLKKVFWGLGGINRTILLDGFVAATWKRKKTPAGMTVNVNPLRTLTTRERSGIKEEFASYSNYQGAQIAVQFENSPF